MDTSLTLPTKEVEQTNRQMMVLQEEANDLTLKTPVDVETAATLLITIKNAQRVILARKEEIVSPIRRGINSVLSMFKPSELALENAEKVVKAKMLAYDTIEKQKIEEGRQRVLARAEKGTIRTDTAIKKLEEIGEGTKMKTRTLTKVRIIDETLIPRDYLVPDMKKITEAVMRAGLTVPGVETYKEKLVTV